MASSVDPRDDVSCFLQATQETMSSVEKISAQAGKRLVMLLNPQWRNVDDALDSASMRTGVIGNFASFLGGKGGSLRRLDELGYESVFTLEGYVCRGGNVRLTKRFDSDWAVFAERDAESGGGYLKVGTSKSRPIYKEVDDMLNEKGITMKYARDIGIAPKL